MQATVCPEMIQLKARGYLHTWAQYGLTLSDAAFFDDTPSLQIDQYPVIRRFYQRTRRESWKRQEQMEPDPL